jgi:hypothetical protein
MPTNSELLSLYGIELKKENKTSSTLRLLNKDSDSRISRGLYDRLLESLNNRSVSKVSLPKVTFGVELEFVGSKSPIHVSNFNTAMIDLFGSRYFYAGSYTHNNGNSWILGRDGSIKYNYSNISYPFGYELSSPKLDLFNKDDINTLAKVIDYIKTYLLGEINLTCGTHIHIGFDNSNSDIYRFSILDLLSAYSRMEKTTFDPIVPSSRRRNRYCKPTRPLLRNKYQKLSSRFCEFSYDGESSVLHFEVRQLEGTLDLDTILYWAKLQSFVLYDLLSHINDPSYIEDLSNRNIFDILFRYDLDPDIVNFFIDRVIEFKSRSIQLS